VFPVIKRLISNGIKKGTLSRIYQHTWFDLGIADYEIFTKISLPASVEYSEKLVTDFVDFLKASEVFQTMQLYKIGDIKQRDEGTVIGDW